MFTKAPKVAGGIGKLMLMKLGWKEGEGLGKNKHGMTDPIPVNIKTDRKGGVLSVGSCFFEWSLLHLHHFNLSFVGNMYHFTYTHTGFVWSEEDPDQLRMKALEKAMRQQALIRQMAFMRQVCCG